MLHREITIDSEPYTITASIKIPENPDTGKGIILAHGAIINRQSLIRSSYSLAEYLCRELDAYVIAPDLRCDTCSQTPTNLEDLSMIFNLTSEYLVETYHLDTLMGFGHSMGCYVVSEALQDNPYLDMIVNYGGPIKELTGGRQRGFIDYLVNYLQVFNYGINTRKLVKYIFDKETTRYLEEVMLHEPLYCSENYDFTIEPSMFTNLQKTITQYLASIEKWGKPALLLFGSEDRVTSRTFNHYPDNHVDNNILFKHINGASHITPCMQTHHQLRKLEPIVSFYRENQTLLESCSATVAEKTQ